MNSDGGRVDDGQVPRSDSRAKMFSRLKMFGGATVGLATIFGTIYAVVGPFGSSNNPGTTSSSSPQQGRSSASTPSGSPIATKNTPLDIYYQRPISVGISSGGNGLDFDLQPPGAGPGPVSFFYDTFALKKGGSSTVGFGFAVWIKGGMPTASDCKTWVSTHLVGGVYAPTVGTKICFRTDGGHIGLLVVQAGTSENQFNAIASVWNR
jgi:hypothetical protein